MKTPPTHSRVAFNVALSFVAAALVPALFGCSSGAEGPGGPLFRFGLVADVQFARKPDAGTRRYESALHRLRLCIDAWREEPLDFAVQVGDIIDGRETLEQSIEDLDLVLDAMRRFEHPFMHVLGNHCLSIPRPELLPRLGLASPYYAYMRDGWRFLMIDSLDFSTSGGWPPDSEPHLSAQAWLDEHAGEVNAKRWNGGLRAEQLEWIGQQLAAAKAAGERVVFFSHLPVNPVAGSADFVLFNHVDLLELIAANDHVLAYISGHDHVGSYAQVDGVHYLTLPALLDAPEGSNAWATVDVYADRLEIAGNGDVASRVLAASE